MTLTIKDAGVVLNDYRKVVDLFLVITFLSDCSLHSNHKLSLLVHSLLYLLEAGVL